MTQPISSEMRATRFVRRGIARIALGSGELVLDGSLAYTAKEWNRIRHGTIGGYSNDGCRCEPCRVAWRTYQREYYRRPEVKIKRAAYQSELRRLANLAREAGLA